MRLGRRSEEAGGLRLKLAQTSIYFASLCPRVPVNVSTKGSQNRRNHPIQLRGISGIPLGTSARSSHNPDAINGAQINSPPCCLIFCQILAW